jgi:hypothetical protein
MSIELWRHASIHITCSATISTKHDAPLFVSLLHLPTQREYRSRSKQFYAVVRDCQFPAEYFTSFYIDLTQFEASHYTDVEETFIALLSLIPVTEELVTLTLDRLFAAPTCALLSVPFVHTVDCWTAALSYVSTPIVIPHLKNSLLSLMSVPSSTLIVG